MSYPMLPPLNDRFPLKLIWPATALVLAEKFVSVLPGRMNAIGNGSSCPRCYPCRQPAAGRWRSVGAGRIAGDIERADGLDIDCGERGACRGIDDAAADCLALLANATRRLNLCYCAASSGVGRRAGAHHLRRIHDRPR